MPAPIMPAPSTPSFCTCDFGTPAGRTESLSALPLFTNIVRIRLRETGPVDQRREILRLDVEPLVDRQDRAFVHARQDRGRRRVIVQRLLRDERRRAREGLAYGRALPKPAPPGTLEAFLVPRLHGRRRAEQPALRRRRSVRPAARPRARGRASSLPGAEMLPPSSRYGSDCAMPISRGMRCVPPPPGSRPDLHFGQADERLRVVRHDAVMAGEAQLESAAEREPVDRGDPGLAAGLDAPEQLLQPAARTRS